MNTSRYLQNQTTARSRDMTAPGRRCSPVMSHRQMMMLSHHHQLHVVAGVSHEHEHSTAANATLHSVDPRRALQRQRQRQQPERGQRQRQRREERAFDAVIRQHYSLLHYYSLQCGHAQLFALCCLVLVATIQLTHPTIRPRLPPQPPIQSNPVPIQSRCDSASPILSSFPLWLTLHLQTQTHFLLPPRASPAIVSGQMAATAACCPPLSCAPCDQLQALQQKHVSLVSPLHSRRTP
jgi:hypothetical protein